MVTVTTGSAAVIKDRDTGREANVIQRVTDGKNALVTDASVVVTSTFGQFPFPDTYFQVVETGPEGTTWDIHLDGISDPSASERDVPAFDKTFTVLAGEVNKEEDFTNRIISELNLSSDFKDSLLKATDFTNRQIVYIRSSVFSTTGQYYERPGVDTFTVDVVGGGVVDVAFDNLISRTKPVSLDIDPDNPNIGVFGISGSVQVQQKQLSDLFFAEALNVTYGNDLLQSGSLGSPVVFEVGAEVDKAVLIEDMFFSGQGNGIKFGQFLSKSGAGGVPNGILVEIKSDNIVTQFPIIHSTEDFKNRWAALSGDGANFRIDVQAGKDEMLAILRFNNPFVIREDAAFGAGNNDYIKVFIRDSLTSGISRFDFACKGFEKEP